MKRTLRGLLRIMLSDVRYVFSGLTRAPRDMQMVKDHGGVEVLISYAHARHDRYAKWAEHVRRLGLRVMVDSGAYTVFAAQQKGVPIDPIAVKDYADWIIKNRDQGVVIHNVVNLDVIGDPRTSERNWEYLLSRGIHAIPVWHCQSPWDALDALVKKDEPIIAIGGTVFLSTKERREVFDVLHRRFSGQAFHLLGGTSPVISEYPWYSTDGTSYLAGRKYRKLVTPVLQMPAPEEWTSNECLAFSIAYLSKLEGNYERHYEFPLLIKPEIVDARKVPQQLSLFA